MSVTVVVPVHGKASLTRHCLDQLLAQELPDGTRLLVVDDASPDDTGALLASYGDRIDVLHLPVNVGFGAACNRGVAAARTELVVLLNNDTTPHPGWLHALVQEAEDHPAAAAIGARLLHLDGTVQHAGVVFGRDRLPHHAYAGFPGDHPAVVRSRAFQVVTGACLLLRADAVRAVGPVPEDYFLYFEETDYCRRLAGGGWRLVVDPRARAVHHKRSSGLLPTPAYVYYMRRNKVLFARRLGLDTAEVLAEFRRVWEDPWRANVARRAPGWLPTFDALVALAAADADADRTGPQDLSPYASAPESE